MQTKNNDNNKDDKNKRLSWNKYFMKIAKMAAKRSTCPKESVGAVVVQDKKVIGTGYNGAPSGMPHCADIGCVEDKENHCIRSVHAEQNAILHSGVAAYDSSQSKIYCTHRPCIECCKFIIQAGISQVFYEKEYYDGKCHLLGIKNQDEFLRDGQVEVNQIKIKK